MKMFLLALIILAVSGVYSDSHSINYYRTLVSAKGSGLPEFSTVGFVDDQQINTYSSDIGKHVSVAPWVKNIEGPAFWERWIIGNKVLGSIMRDALKMAMIQFNHTEGFHFMQIICCSELRDDDSTVGYVLVRYDGTDHMYLDMRTGSLVPTVAEAQTATQKWNSPDVRMGEIFRNHMEMEYVARLKKYIEFGREDLERRVRPQVKVSGQEQEDIMKLHCQVYGFYPRPVDVKWMNGEDEVPPYETTHVLPNPDSTYQIRVSAEVIPKDGDSYSCYVDHSSLEEPLLVKWEPKHNFVLPVTISAVVVLIIILTLTTGIIYKKKKDKFTAVSDEDDRSFKPPVI